MKTQITIAVIVVMALAFVAAKPLPEAKAIIPSKTNVGTQSSYAGFSFFRIHRQGKGVTSTWGMSSESGVAGYVIQRTYLDPSDPYGWEDVNAVASNGSRSYKWTDETVFAGFISYRIVAMMNGGSPELISDVETIHIMGH